MKRTLLILGACVVLGSCGRKVACEKPEEVVKTFYGAVALGDTQTAFQLISGADRRTLKKRAAAASETTGKELEGPDLIVPGLVQLPGELAGASFEPVKVEVGDVKEVRITFAGGSTARTPVVREASCYRVPLGLQ